MRVVFRKWSEHLFLQVLASKGSDLLDFHKDLGSLESASKVCLCGFVLYLSSIPWLSLAQSFDFFVDSDTIEVAGGGNASYYQRVGETEPGAHCIGK